MLETTRLINAIAALRETVSPDPIHLEEVRNALNEFIPEAECLDFMLTNNTDRIPFGINVFPQLTSDMINKILLSGEEMVLTKYYVELDSKVFLYGLEDDEILAVMLYNITHLTDKSASPVSRLRGAIDLYFTSSATQLKIRESLQYQQILTLGLVDTLVKFTNCLYLDSDVLADPYLKALDLDYAFDGGCSKLFNKIPGFENSASRSPALIILDWCFRLYADVEHQRIPAIKQLERSKDITASALYKRLFDRAIDALHKIDTDTLVESTVIKESKKGSLFSQIKYNGLRGIEDDFYEFMVRARNAESEEEVMYALKQINIRLSILDDYIRNENLSEEDKKRWTALYIKYTNIRDEIANKKVYNKRNYGVFFDYNQLDNVYDD